MTGRTVELQQQYVEGLRTYAHHRSELALIGAYEMGRRALAEGLGVLDMAVLHNVALEQLVFTVPPVARDPLARAAAEYFSELLSPFEMTFRGYRVANDELQRLNETLREQKDALEALNRELESFSYSVSHDLRGPLRAIDGFSLALLEDYGERLEPEGQRYLGNIRDATRRMAQLIEDMLELAQVTRREMRREDVHLSHIVLDVCRRLQAAAPAREVELCIEPDVHASGDTRLLTVLLENLLGNAWKFTSRQPHAKIEFGVQAKDGGRVYHVRDNGAGFDMTLAAKLFQPFSRLHAARDYEGTGVGLAIVRRVVHRHGGEIWAEAKVGEGATFFFMLDGTRSP